METELKTDGQKAEVEQVAEVQEEENKEQNNETEVSISLNQERNAENDTVSRDAVNDAAETGENEADHENDDVPEDYENLPSTIKCSYLESTLQEVSSKTLGIRKVVKDVIVDLEEASKALNQGPPDGSIPITSAQKANVLQKLGQVKDVTKRLQAKLRKYIVSSAKKKPKPENQAAASAAAKAAENEAVSFESQIVRLQSAFFEIYEGMRKLSSDMSENLVNDLPDDKRMNFEQKNNMYVKLHRLQTLARSLEEKRMKALALFEELDDALMYADRVIALRNNFHAITRILIKTTDDIEKRLIYFFIYLTEDAKPDESGVVEVDESEVVEVDGSREEREEVREDGEAEEEEDEDSQDGEAEEEEDEDSQDDEEEDEDDDSMEGDEEQTEEDDNFEGNQFEEEHDYFGANVYEDDDDDADDFDPERVKKEYINTRKQQAREDIEEDALSFSHNFY